MKLVETTGPIDLVRNVPLFTESGNRVGNWKARRINFEIIRCHACTSGPAWDSGGRAGCDYLHHIDMVMSGHAQVVHPGGVLDLKPGYAYFLPGNVPVQRRCRRSYDVCYVAFRCEWFPGIDVLLDWPDRAPVRLGQWRPAEWEADLDPEAPPSLTSLLKLKSQIGLWMAAALPDLEAILANHIRVHAGFERVFEYVETHLQAGLRVASLARVNGRRLQAFSLAFSRALGMSPKAYIDRRLNEEIIRRLVSTDAPVKAIAAEVGFADEYLFNRFFSRMNGIPPSRYRRQFLGGSTPGSRGR